ncbi:hypothetical protein AA313_de0206947 [Arthrobotrys entomopaga]|nr:hypothetical protein AA313_de0206947 [Arthrobotrys entomopaga]
MWSKLSQKPLAISFAALAGNLIFAKSVLASDAPITVTQYVTVTETPTVTAFLDERQLNCPQTLDFCSNVLASWSSQDLDSQCYANAKFTYIAAFPTLSAGQIFAIQIEILENAPNLETQPHLEIVEPYVVANRSSVIVGWFLDESDNLMFDGTGLRLGVAPLDSPNPKKRALEIRDGGTVVAGALNAPINGQTFVKWAYGQPEAHYGDPNYLLTLKVMDDYDQVIPLTFLGCKEAAPKLNTSLWQLEAVYDRDSFFATNTIPGLTSASCHPINLQIVTISGLTPLPTSVMPETSTNPFTTPTTFTTPTPTSPSWTNFPIRVDFGSQNPERDTLTGYYIAEASNGNFYIGKDAGSPASYFNYNMTKFLVAQDTGTDLRIHVSKATTDLTDPNSYVWIDRFELLGNGTLLLLDEDSVLTASYIACSADEEGTDYLLGAAVNVDAYLALDPSCQVVYLVGESSINPTTTVVPTTRTTITTPTATMTNLDPNINGCNNLNYTFAYATTGLANAFATACYCWSYLATTVEATTTEDCTLTVFKDVPTITSISVSGVLSLASRRDLLFPRGMIVRDHELVARNTTPAASDIIVIPTPTDFASAAVSIVDDACQSLLDANDIATLTITSLDVVDDVEATTLITRTTVQTVCYEATYISEIEMTTSLVVVCPASVTSAAETTFVAGS